MRCPSYFDHRAFYISTQDAQLELILQGIQYKLFVNDVFLYVNIEDSCR